jgi:DNA mismatch repair ATPase MutS
MSFIIDHLTPGSILLLNESFASTNEREGSEIAGQIVRALVDAGIKVFYVTHMFDLAHGFCVEETATARFLRAERHADGQRTFRLVEGEPLPTSYGEDVYRRTFDPGREAVGLEG